MKFALRLLFGLAFFGGGAWVTFGTAPAELWVRAAIFGGTFVAVSIALAIYANAERDAHLKRNEEHSQRRGHRYREEAPLAEFVSAESTFPNDSRIESIAQGVQKGSTFTVFDLSWEETTREEGGSSTTTIAQTVALLPGQLPQGAPLPVIPFQGVGGVLSFLGLTGSISPNPKVLVGDTELLAWFEQNYHVTWSDEARTRAECLLRLPVLRWLRGHAGIAFNLVDGQLYLWRPNLIVDADAREELVADALQLAELLRVNSIASEDGDSQPAFQVQPPAVASLDGVAWRLFVSAFGSWAIACVTALGVFFFGIISGVMEILGPHVFMVATMSLVLVVWIAAGFAIHYWMTRPSSRTDIQ